jgi:hypothetical protein
MSFLQNVGRGERGENDSLNATHTTSTTITAHRGCLWHWRCLKFLKNLHSRTGDEIVPHQNTFL